MTHFIGTITTRQLGRLRGSAARASIQNIDCFALQRCILVLHELQDKLQGVVSSADPEVVEDLQNVSDTAAGLCDLSALQGRLDNLLVSGICLGDVAKVACDLVLAGQRQMRNMELS